MSEYFLPLMIFIAPGVLAALVYPLRRWKIGVWIAAAAAILMAWATLFVLPERGFVLLGRQFFVDTFSAQVWGGLWLALAVLFALSAEFSQGWTFFPAGILLVGLSGWAMASPHLGIAALFMEIAALVSVFAIQGGRIGSVRAAQRFLVMMTLATPLFLLAAWYLDAAPGGKFAGQIALLSAGGFALWLGVAPLHGWITAMARESLPGVTVLVVLIFPTVALVWLLRLTVVAPWLGDVQFASTALLWGGALSIIVGGGFTAAQNSFSALLGYSAVFQLGASVMALGLQNKTGVTIVLFGLAVRFVALLVLAAAIAIIRQGIKRDAFDRAAGIARWYPVAAFGLMVGGAALAGAPLTGGFISHWFLLKATAGVDSRLPVVVLLGSIGVTTGYLRGLWYLLRPAVAGASFSTGRYWMASAIIFVGSIAIIAVGIFPQSLLNWIAAI